MLPLRPVGAGVTLIEAVYAHPVWTVVLMFGAGNGLSLVVRAVTEPLAPCRRGSCPRCHGTGSEERIRAAQ